MRGVDLTTDDCVCVWVARVQDRRGETATTAWSALDKAQSWFEWRLEADLSWDEPGGDRGQDPITGIAAGAEVAEIRRVTVQDPVSLAQRFPSTLPASRFIPDE